MVLTQKFFCCHKTPFSKKSFVPLDPLTGLLGLGPERGGCPAGPKPSRHAMFYDSEGKGKNFKTKSSPEAALPLDLSFILWVSGFSARSACRPAANGTGTCGLLGKAPSLPLLSAVIGPFNAEATCTGCWKGALPLFLQPVVPPPLWCFWSKNCSLFDVDNARALVKRIGKRVSVVEWGLRDTRCFVIHKGRIVGLPLVYPLSCCFSDVIPVCWIGRKA